MEQTELFQKFGMALLLGLLIGVERERTTQGDEQEKLFSFGGIRTYPFFSLFGCLLSTVSPIFGASVLAVGLGGMVLLIAISYYRSSKGEAGLGLTSEMAAILAFCLGILAATGEFAIASALAVIIVVLLASKGFLHNITQKIGRQDIQIALQFAVITFIVLPVLPDAAYGPLKAFNPYSVWKMVVLISGIGFLGYLMMRILGAEKGISLTGILGGLVSSTAVTLTFSRKSKEQPELSRTFALAIVLACTTMLPRIALEVSVVYMPLLYTLWLPLTVMFLVGVGGGLFLFFKSEKSQESVTVSNPLSMSTAVKFGLLYAAIQFAAKAAQTYFPTGGLYAVSVLSGLNDVDAITLSVSKLCSENSVNQLVASQSIILAALTNTCVKMGLAFNLASRKAFKYMIFSLGASAVGGGVTLIVLPYLAG